MVRFREYRCPVNSVLHAGDPVMSQCRYEWTDKECEPCEGCGKSYEETRTIWDKAEDLYHTVVAYRFRPKNLWYDFSCWAWKRYSTTKPRTLGHGWCDRDALLIHTVFEIARNFIEKEGPENEEEWAWQAEHNPAFYASWHETKEILDWWENEYEESYVWGLTDEEFDKEYPWDLVVESQKHEWDPSVSEEERTKTLRGREKLKRDEEYEQNLRNKAKRIIEISPYYWT